MLRRQYANVPARLHMSPIHVPLTPCMVKEKRAGRVDGDLRLLMEVVAVDKGALAKLTHHMPRGGAGP